MLGCQDAISAPYIRLTERELRSIPILGAFRHQRARSCRLRDNNFRRAATEANHIACDNHRPNSHLGRIYHPDVNFSRLDQAGRKEDFSLPTLVDNGPHWIVHPLLIAQPEKRRAKLRSRKKHSSSNSPILSAALMGLETVLFNSTWLAQVAIRHSQNSRADRFVSGHSSKKRCRPKNLRAYRHSPFACKTFARIVLPLLARGKRRFGSAKREFSGHRFSAVQRKSGITPRTATVAW